MRIHVLSDLHLESGPYSIPPGLDYDVLVAAGDIDEGIAGVEWLRTLDKPVVYVPGNHEYYSSGAAVDMCERITEIRTAAANSNVHVLDNESVIINGVRFLGATLWTDFGALDEGLLQNANEKMNDYRRIKASSWYAQPENRDLFCRIYQYVRNKDVVPFRSTAPVGEYEITGIADLEIQSGIFSPFVAFCLHLKSLAWIDSCLKKPFDGETVVVTHHHPSYESLRRSGVNATLIADRSHWNHRSMEVCRIAAYASDLDKLLGRHRSAISLWIAGHLHTHLDYMHKGVRLVCNPRGHAILPLKESEKDAYSFLGYPISDEAIARSEKIHAEDRNRGSAIGFKQDFVVDLEDGLTPCMEWESNQLAPSLVKLHDEIIKFAPFVDYDQEVIQESIIEAISTRAAQFSKIVTEFSNQVSDNLFSSEFKFTLDSLVAPNIPNLGTLDYEPTRFLQGDEFPTPYTDHADEVTRVIQIQKRLLESLPQFANIIRSIERQTKQSIVDVLKSIEVMGISVKVVLPNQVTKKWRHISPYVNAWLLIENGSDENFSQINKMLNAKRKNNIQDALSLNATFFLHDTAKEGQFRNSGTQEFSLETLEIEWREILTKQTKMGEP